LARRSHEIPHSIFFLIQFKNGIDNDQFELPPTPPKT